jgi:hypothetical protein
VSLERNPVKIPQKESEPLSRPSIFLGIVEITEERSNVGVIARRESEILFGDRVQDDCM